MAGRDAEWSAAGPQWCDTADYPRVCPTFGSRIPRAGESRDHNRDVPLSKTELEKIDAYWRAANYLSVGQIYLLDNPLLTEPLLTVPLQPEPLLTVPLQPEPLRPEPLRPEPLRPEPLRPGHIKPRLLGHWKTTPGLNLIYAHLNRVIRNWDLDVVYLAGPGHGGPGIVANTGVPGPGGTAQPSPACDRR